MLKTYTQLLHIILCNIRACSYSDYRFDNDAFLQGSCIVGSAAIYMNPVFLVVREMPDYLESWSTTVLP